MRAVDTMVLTWADKIKGAGAGKTVNPGNNDPTMVKTQPASSQLSSEVSLASHLRSKLYLWSSISANPYLSYLANGVVPVFKS